MYKVGDVLAFLDAQSADVCPDVRHRVRSSPPETLTAEA
jgi:hypothetical protein